MREERRLYRRKQQPFGKASEALRSRGERERPTPSRAKEQDKTDAKQLRELIARACLTGSAFAREIGYSERMIRYMLSGERPVERVVILAAEHLAKCESTRHAREERQGWVRERMARTDCC